MPTVFRVAAAIIAFCVSTGSSPTRNRCRRKSPPAPRSIPIPSLTLSDQQFLSGDAAGKPVTVAGEFRVAQGTGRCPSWC